MKETNKVVAMQVEADMPFWRRLRLPFGLPQMPKLPGWLGQKRNLALVGAAALVILLVGGGLFIYNRDYKRSDSLATTQGKIHQATLPTKDVKMSISELKSAERHAATQLGKQQAASILASRYSSAGNHRQALHYYQEAISLEPAKTTDINSILGVANEAEALKDNKQAKAYYQKAVDYYAPLAKTNQTYNTVITALKTRQDALK